MMQYNFGKNNANKINEQEVTSIMTNKEHRKSILACLLAIATVCSVSACGRMHPQQTHRKTSCQIKTMLQNQKPILRQLRLGKTARKKAAEGGELIDYAAKEQSENARPELTSHIENLDEYDVIFVGYPNWWYDMPMVMYSFFEEYDFSGKTIIPFDVHNGSRFSSTISTIQELEPDAVVIEDGFTVNERNVPDAAEDVQTWLDGLNL